MDVATRHAARLANNFFDDVESLQRQSKARDRRAMSHFENRARSSSLMSDNRSRRRRSLTITTPSTYITSATPYTYYVWPTPKAEYVPAVRTRYIPTYVPPVMMVGKSIYSSQFPYTNIFSYDGPRRRQFWYDQVVNHPESALPTSTLRASAPPKKNILSPGAEAYLTSGLSPWRRAMSEADLLDLEEPAPRIVRAPVLRRNPPPRLSSVPPVPISTYRPLTYSSELGVTPSVPRTYYRTSRVYSETPYYLSNYSTRTGEPGRPIFSTSYTSSPSAYSRRYTYYYPAVVTGRNYYSPLATSYNAWSPEMQIERRRIQRRMDDLLDYKLPPPEYYREMRGSLRSLNDKLDEHRRLLDRYSGIDMNAAQGSVAEGIESKFQQLANRVTAQA